jgi:hypothetical protein
MVSWFSVLTAGKVLGVSTTFVRTIGMIESIFIPARVASLPYFVKEKHLRRTWMWPLSALASRDPILCLRGNRLTRVVLIFGDESNSECPCLPTGRDCGIRNEWFFEP